MQGHCCNKNRNEAFSSLDNKENKVNRLEKKQTDLKDLTTPSFNCY